MGQNCWDENKYGVDAWRARIEPDVHFGRSNVLKNVRLDERGLMRPSGSFFPAFPHGPRLGLSTLAMLAASLVARRQS